MRFSNLKPILIMDKDNKGYLIWILLLIGVLTYLFIKTPLDTLIESGKELYGIVGFATLVLVYFFLTKFLEIESKILIILVLVAIFILLILLQLWCDLTTLYLAFGILFFVIIGVLIVGFFYMLTH